MKIFIWESLKKFHNNIVLYMKKIVLQYIKLNNLLEYSKEHSFFKIYLTENLKLISYKKAVHFLKHGNMLVYEFYNI